MVLLREDNRVHARVTLDYNRGSVDIGESGAQRAARENFIRQSVSVILDIGKAARRGAVGGSGRRPARHPGAESDDPEVAPASAWSGTAGG